MNIVQSKNKYLWYIVDNDSKIVRIAHSRLEAIEILKRLNFIKENNGKDKT